MNIKRIDFYCLSFISLMWLISFIFSFFVEDIDFIFSISIFFAISSFGISAYVKKESIFQLRYIYIMGFSLFICGRFFAYLLSDDMEIFRFDFGLVYDYNKEPYEKLRVYNLVYSSFLFYVLGSSLTVKYGAECNVFMPKNKFRLLFLLSFFLFGYLLIGNINSIIKSQEYGYLSLYESQGDSYNTPLNLILSALFISLLSFFYSIRRYNNKFYFLVFLFIFLQLLTIFSGGRGAFVSAFLILGWIFFRYKPVSLKWVVVLIFFIFIFILLVNFLLVFTSRSAESGSILEIITSNLYNQGISLMVFDLSTKIDSYPILAMLKTLIPGIQLLFTPLLGSLETYEVSFPHYITYLSAPELYYQGYGYGWALLADFYVFSFSIFPIFLLFNLFWGMLLSRLDKTTNNAYYEGLSFIFVTQIFMLSRASVSTLVASIIIYTFIHFVILRLRIK